MKLQDFNIVDECNHYYTAFCPKHNDVNTPNVTITKIGRYIGHWKCWACGEGGIVSDMILEGINKTIICKPKQKIDINWKSLNRYYVNNGKLHSDKLLELADSLDLPLWTLVQLGLGYDGKAYTFPVHNADEEIIGIALRFPDGSKRMVRGSEVGIYLGNGVLDVSWMRIRNRLVICEGATDLATMVRIYSTAIGMFNNETPIEVVYNYILKHKPAETIIFPDGDTPGVSGANKLARKIMDITHVKVFPMLAGYDVRKYCAEKDREAISYILECIHA